MTDKIKSFPFAGHAPFVNWSASNSLAVKQVAKWAVYIGNGLEMKTANDSAIWDFVEQQIRVLYIDEDACLDCLCNIIDGGLFFFNTKEDMNTFYAIFTAPLTDSSAIYACTYSPDGQCLTENT